MWEGSKTCNQEWIRSKLSHKISVDHQNSTNTSDIGFYFSSFKYQERSSFLNIYYGWNAKKTLGLEVKAGALLAWRYAQIWDSFEGLLCFMAPSWFSSSIAAPEILGGPSLFAVLSLLQHLWDAGGSAHLVIDLQCSTSPSCFALTSWKNHLPSHSAELNWMVWGNLNISAFLFIYI